MTQDVLMQIITIGAVALIGVATFVRIYLKLKNKTDEDNDGNPDINQDNYLELIFTTLQNVASDCLKATNFKIEDFGSAEEYYKTLIGFIIDTIRKNSHELGINPDLFNLIDQELLEKYIYLAITKLMVKTSSEVPENPEIAAASNSFYDDSADEL